MEEKEIVTRLEMKLNTVEISVLKTMEGIFRLPPVSIYISLDDTRISFS